jgi:hypothetical protein
MAPSAKEHNAESMDDSSTSFGEDSNSVSWKTKEDDRKPRAAKKKGSKTSLQPTSQSGLPTFAAAAAAAAPRNEKRPRKAGFRDHFLPKVRSIRNTNHHTCLPRANSNNIFSFLFCNRNINANLRNNSSE